MDTLPFHSFLIALDFVVMLSIFLWLRFKRIPRDINNLSIPILPMCGPLQPLYQPPQSVRKPSLLWDCAGVMLFSAFWLFCFAVLSCLIFTDFFQKHIFNFNVGQCIVEGFCYHGTPLLLLAGILLCRYRRVYLASLLFLLGFALGGVGFDILYWEPYCLKIETYEIRSPKIKYRCRVVFVADIQTDRIGRHEERTLEKIKQQKPDLIILGGDYIQGHSGTTNATQLLEQFRQLFVRHQLKAPLGVFAISGNIGPTDKTLFGDTGVDVVTQSTIIDDLGKKEGIGPIDLVLLGLGDARGGVDEQGLTESGNFIVMAGHYPNFAVDGYKSKSSGKHYKGYRNAKRAPDLMLAGHTHGGQVSLPYMGMIFQETAGDNYVQQLPHNMVRGFFTYPNGGHLLVSRGSGMERGWAPRIRMFCPSEISVIDLLPEK